MDELSATISVLGGGSAATPATLDRIASRELALRSHRSFELRAALKISTADCLWMGEVTACRNSGPDEWLVTICIEHALHDFEALAGLAERFSDRREMGVQERAEDTHEPRPLPASR